MANTAASRLASLARAFEGELLEPSDAGYETARRVWNGAIDRRPALIARCTCQADVVAAIRFARERELVVAVRGGGHNVAGSGTCDGGIVIDLSPMKRATVDSAARTARVEPGLLWGELDSATQTSGLAVTGGIQSTTGIAGFTLGGGIGWLSRRQGHTCDHLLQAELVTADGDVVTAGHEGDPELFFGVRGGGGNFGIATSFTYRLEPLEQIVAGMVWHPAERARAVLGFFRDWAAELPDELGAILFLVTAPDTGVVPPELRGRPTVAIGVCWAGPIHRAELALAPLRAFGPPAADTIGPIWYECVQRQLDAANPPGHQNYWKAEYLSEPTDAALDAIAEHGARMPAGLSKALLVRLGGVAGRAADAATAFGHRDAPYLLNINGMSPDPGDLDRLVSWARAFWDALRPFSFGGAYVNFLGDEGQDRVRAAYGEATYERLRALKRRYDPDNVFRLNQNVAP